MALFPPDMPRPEPERDDRGFWEACRRRELRFQRCAACATARHPPSPMCPACQSVAVEWVAAPAQARVFTFTVVHHASHPAVSASLPYVVAVVEFDGLPGVRLVTNLTDVEPAAVRIGMPVAPWWDDAGDGQWLPRVRPVLG